MLHPFAHEFWIVDGPEVAVAGFAYPTRMAVIRLRDGGLFIWSPIALDDAMRTALELLGPVRYLVAPNTLHHLFLAEWQRACPDARLYAPPGLRRKRPDLRVDADLDGPDLPWTDEIDQVAMGGNLITTETVFFHRTSQTMLVTDLLQHISADRLSGWRAWVARLDLMTGPEPAVPRKFRLAFVNRTVARAAYRRLIAWPTERIVMAHGTPVTHDARAFLRRAFAWLV